MSQLKSIFRFRVIVVFIFIAAAPAHGQTLGEDAAYQRDSSEKLFGKLSASVAEGSSHHTNYQSLELGYDTPFHNERGRFYFSAAATNTSLELDLELDESADNLPMAGRPRTMTRDEDESDFDVHDAFVQYGLPGGLIFTAGRRRVAWGQFDLLSPVNLALPLTPQTAEPIVSKINTLVPQDQVALSWFPGDRMEVQGYYFFSTEIDYLLEEVIEGDTTENIYDENGMLGEATADRNDLSDHSHYAVRVLFYPDWGVLGFTWHEGRDPLAFDSDLATVERIGETTFSAFNVHRHTDLHKTENFGVELSVPYGQWVWKFEALYQETSIDLKGYSHLYRGDTSGSVYTYLNAVVTDNNAQLYVPVDRTLIGIGADTDRDNWRFNIGLFILNENYDSDAEELIELEEEAGFDENRGDTIVLPALNIARYIGGDKEKELGFAGGFLGAYAGASLYYASHIGEDLRWVIGVEAASNLRDQLISDTGPDNDRYELEDDFSTGFRASVTYSF